MQYGAKTITNTATLIVGPNSSRRNLTIVNTSEGVPVYYGPDNLVTTANGIPLYETATRDQDNIPEGFKGAIYGIVASGSADVRYWETDNA